MIEKVIKKDGSEVSFDVNKIKGSITRAAQDAKLEQVEIDKIVGDVSNTIMVFAESKNKLMSSEIKDKILSELDLIAPRVSAEWRKFMEANKK